MKVDLEYTNCGFCGAQSYNTLYSAPEHILYSQCDVVQCSNCSLVRTNPRPTQTALAEVYNNEYYSRQTPNLQGWGNKLKIFALKHSLSYLYPYVIPFQIPKNAVICDVGCGAGQWLGLMRAAHPDAVLHGFEIDPETASRAANFCGGDVRHGDFLNNGWSSSSFDFITFWDVLEHVDNPKSVMQEVTRLLKPNGFLVVVSPNFDCIYSKVFKQFWWALLFHEHLYHFSRETLSKLFIACGLEPVYFAIPITHPVVNWNILNLLENMEFKELTNTKKYVLLSRLNKVIVMIDKLNVSRFLSQHLIMCAKKA